MRLFVALALPQELRVRLFRLSTALPGARWLPPENFHLTLRFLGEMPGHRAEDLDDALAALRGKRSPCRSAASACSKRPAAPRRSGRA